tara:strand:+ start:435 stop:686 length:252 start_codon:yes stop_codon:yes gene_type:complete
MGYYDINNTEIRGIKTMQDNKQDNKQILKDLFKNKFSDLLPDHTVSNMCDMVDLVCFEAEKKGFIECSKIWKKAVENMGKDKV